MQLLISFFGYHLSFRVSRNQSGKKLVIGILEAQLHIMETNEPINRAAGNIAQADLEAQTAKEIIEAIIDLA